MKALLQRVIEARVTSEGELLGSINQGLLVLVGFEKEDNLSVATRTLEKILSYRIFNDKNDRMNLSVKDIDGAVLLVPQFTLVAATGRGSRPSFSDAMEPNEASDLFETSYQWLRGVHRLVASGRFGANMQVALVNDGPITFLLESH